MAVETGIHPLPDAVKGWLCWAFIISEDAGPLLKIQSPVSRPQLNGHSQRKLDKGWASRLRGRAGDAHTIQR